MKYTEAIDAVKEAIESDKEYNQDPNSASWGYEYGVLITQSQAQCLLDRIAELEAGLKEIVDMNSTQLIEGSQERWHELKNYEFDWKSFYNGWLESRVKFLIKAKELLK